MHEELLARLSIITGEEQKILDGNTDIDRSIYYRSEDKKVSADEVDASLVLQNGRLIDLRPHVRFIHFPKHTHNYVEFVYMCKGSTTHIIDGRTILLEEGDLLFLNQHAAQEILPAGRDDIAVNFMILPEFFDSTLRMISSEESPLKDFIISCLTDINKGDNFLYFHIQDLLPAQNLMENLIWTMLRGEPQRRTLSQTTMGLLFLYLINHTETIRTSGSSYDQEMMIRLLSYIETEYKNAALSEFAGQNGIDNYTLSRLIKKNTGRTFKELLQEKRMSQACFLLKNTPLRVDDIAAAVGYDNTSYFHRLFLRTFGIQPRQYRIERQ
ncbi:MAG: helix-turn-helix domain-containing protein [Lachnospiraceae bacterium]|nr:helix-turn-helix domain-containing protein [Lachnospiraceae bacterium]